MAETKMQLEEWLDDLCVRFIINLPQEDLSSVARICFQVEEAQWFYEDFIRPLDPTLPSMSLRSFCLRIFQHCPLLAPFSVENHMRAFEEFLQYKTRVPVRGAILLNHDMDSTVLVKGWKKGANWSFPRGKINKDEDDLDCAIREVYEETGFDIREAGLVPKDDEVKYIQISMREQQIRLYVFRDVPMDTLFEPKTRKEISKIQWYKLSELPAFRKKGNNNHDDAAAASNANKFYMVAPFLVPLKKWVVQQKKKDATRPANHSLLSHALHEELLTEDDMGAQTEAVPDLPSSGAAIETLEGATRELQRLLKIQPPTQGLQMGPSGSTSQDKGEALMAILQKNGQERPQQHTTSAPYQTPHTPYDLTYATAPQPHTPHHHHPTQRLASEYQPPPNFSIPGQSNRHISDSYHGRAQAPMPVMPPNPGFVQNAYMVPGTQQQRQPVLLHPQPLPPQVQQSILTRGILPTPILQEVMGNMVPPAPHGPQNGAGSQTHANLNGPAGAVQGRVPPQHREAQIPSAPLTGHKLSLLNAFKSDAGPPTAPNPQVLNAPAPATGNPAEWNQYQSVPWANPPSAKAPAGASRFLPQNLTQTTGPPSGGSAQASLSNAPATPPTKVAQSMDKHRTALLDIFKKQDPLSPTSSEATVRPSNANMGASSLTSGDTMPAMPKPFSSAEAIRAAAQANGEPIRMNPELNLPYRALEILSRPKHSEKAAPIPQATNAALPSAIRIDMKPMPQPTKRSPRGQNQALRAENEDNKSPRMPQAPQATGLAYNPYHQRPQQPPLQSPRGNQIFPGASGVTPPDMLQRHQSSNPDQKQKLLSLFGKPLQPSPTGTNLSSGDDKAKMKEPVMLDQVRSRSPRSRVASLASVSGDNNGSGAPGSSAMSRQDSLTPISPADRSFLLGYLQQVSNSGR